MNGIKTRSISNYFDEINGESELYQLILKKD